MSTSSTATLDLSNVETDELVIAPSDGEVDEIIEWQPSPMPQSFLSSSGTSGHTDVEDVTISNVDFTPVDRSLHMSDSAEGRRRKTRSRKPRTKRHYKKRRSDKKRTYKRRCKCSKKRRSPRRKYTRRK